MGLMKIFSGAEASAILLQEKIEQANIFTEIRNNNQITFATITTSKPVELFIQESDFGKASQIIEDFRMSF